MKTWRITFTDGTSRDLQGHELKTTDTFLTVTTRPSVYASGRRIPGGSETFVLANVRSWTEVSS